MAADVVWGREVTTLEARAAFLAWRAAGGEMVSVGEGVIDLPTMVERMSCQPARAFRLPGGTLAVGGTADVTVFDPEATWTVDPGAFLSKSRNTPFGGWELKGKPRYTVVGGRVVWES